MKYISWLFVSDICSMYRKIVTHDETKLESTRPVKFDASSGHLGHVNDKMLSEPPGCHERRCILLHVLLPTRPSRPCSCQPSMPHASQSSRVSASLSSRHHLFLFAPSGLQSVIQTSKFMPADFDIQETVVTRHTLFKSCSLNGQRFGIPGSFFNAFRLPNAASLRAFFLNSRFLIVIC